jgi:hypothetical protein
LDKDEKLILVLNIVLRFASKQMETLLQRVMLTIVDEDILT